MVGKRLTQGSDMRIAMLCSSHSVDDERVTFKQAGSLARAGHEVAVFGRPAVSGRPTEGVAARVVRREGGGLLGRLAACVALYRAAERYRPDVVTCHEPESALVGVLLKHRLGMRMIFDAHECFEETLSSRMPCVLRPVVRAATIWLLRMLVPRCDWVTVVSPPNRDFLAAMRRDGRVDIIHNSPPMERFPLCDHDAGGPLWVCHDGYLGQGRGMVQLLEAVALARKTVDVRLLLMGKVQGGEEALYAETVARLALADAIDGPRWVPYAELGGILSRAQIGAVTMQPTPNNYRSLSNKIYNYMACGMAAIVPKGSATADLVAAADCGLAVDATRPEEIARAIVSLAEDPALRRRLGANGRRAIEQQYGWHRMERRLLEIYAALVPPPPAAEEKADASTDPGPAHR